jgi:hypothetical protein
MTPSFLQQSRDFLSVSHPLATGPNKRNSRFGKILEGVFRKGYFTLQTIVVLADIVEKDEQSRIIFGGSILDLSRRVMEDMLYMEYINDKNKEKYSKQFYDYIPIEQKSDLDFMQKSGVKIDEEITAEVDKKYQKSPKKLRDRHNWSGLSVDDLIVWFTQNGQLKGSEKETILKLYVAGNRKNHTSPSDILDHSKQEWLNGAADRDIELGLMITYGSLIKICLLFLEEIETTDKMKEIIFSYWKGINPKIS